MYFVYLVFLTRHVIDCAESLAHGLLVLNTSWTTCRHFASSWYPQSYEHMRCDLLDTTLDDVVVFWTCRTSCCTIALVVTHSFLL